MMKKSVLLVFGFLCASTAQTKTVGIKTYQPVSANFIAGNATNSTNGTASFTYGSNHNVYESFIPADTYHGDPFRSRDAGLQDPIAEFINKTRSKMASGVCYKEVPTLSLVHDPSIIETGNGTDPTMSRIQVCCDGYERNPHIFARCDPICHDGCRNGICTSPNVCVCIPGHVRNFDDRCITTCPLGCGNGICDENGECRCNAGYTIEPNEKKFCIPYCSTACEFGRCVAPNKCDCLAGYLATASGTCEPKCDFCENGKCTGPGVCICNEGYEKRNGVCEAVCDSGCELGQCVAPNTCSCPYHMDLDKSGNKCIPHCDLPCFNGVCAVGNTCACNPGYINDQIQSNVCRPHCPDGCPNGYCSGPNLCLCKPFYRKSGVKGRQTCMPV